MKPHVEELEQRNCPTGLTYHGGPVLKSPLIENVYLGAWQQPAMSVLDNATSDIASSAFMDTLNQYSGVGRGGWWGSVQDGAVGTTITDSHIVHALHRLARQGLLLRGPDVLIQVWVGPGTTLELGGQPFNGAYHSNAGRLVYSVMSYQSNILTNEADMAHELAEATTDPYGNGWYQNGGGGPEVADLASSGPTGLLYGNWEIVSLWSNAAGGPVLPPLTL